MKKLALLSFVLVLLAPVTADAKVAPWRHEECRFQGVDPSPWTAREVHLTIHCALARWPADHSKADYVADRESGFRYDARNVYSGACGIFQHMPHLWPGRVRAFNDALPRWDLGPSCFNARSNVLVAIRMAHTGGWGPWGG